MDNTTQQAEKINLKASDTRRSPDFVPIYMNNTQFAYTKWDIQMICGRVIVSFDKAYHAPEELAVIVMTPQHAKAVLAALRYNVVAYEAEHGEIKLPEERQTSQPTKEQQVLASASRRNKK